MIDIPSAALVNTLEPGAIAISANAVQRSKADALVKAVISESVAASHEALILLFSAKSVVCDSAFSFPAIKLSRAS
jgi:hypothetical protein